MPPLCHSDFILIFYNFIPIYYQNIPKSNKILWHERKMEAILLIKKKYLITELRIRMQLLLISGFEKIKLLA